MAVLLSSHFGLCNLFRFEPFQVFMIIGFVSQFSKLGIKFVLRYGVDYFFSSRPKIVYPVGTLLSWTIFGN